MRVQRGVAKGGVVLSAEGVGRTCWRRVTLVRAAKLRGVVGAAVIGREQNKKQRPPFVTAHQMTQQTELVVAPPPAQIAATNAVDAPGVVDAAVSSGEAPPVRSPVEPPDEAWRVLPSGLLAYRFSPADGASDGVEVWLDAVSRVKLCKHGHSAAQIAHWNCAACPRPKPEWSACDCTSMCGLCMNPSKPRPELPEAAPEYHRVLWRDYEPARLEPTGVLAVRVPGNPKGREVYVDARGKARCPHGLTASSIAKRDSRIRRGGGGGHGCCSADRVEEEEELAPPLPPPLFWRRIVASASTVAITLAIMPCASSSSGLKGTTSSSCMNAEPSGVTSVAASESSSARTSALALAHGSREGSVSEAQSYRACLSKELPERLNSVAADVSFMPASAPPAATAMRSTAARRVVRKASPIGLPATWVSIIWSCERSSRLRAMRYKRAALSVGSPQWALGAAADFLFRWLDPSASLGLPTPTSIGSHASTSVRTPTVRAASRRARRPGTAPADPR